MCKENKYVQAEKAAVRKDLREYGYQTIREFTDKFAQGLYVYMCTNWPSVDGTDLHHPEDLASNVLAYAEAVHTTIQTFGAGNTSDKNNLPVYVATDEFLSELWELGYFGTIELDDLIDLLDEDPAYIEQIRPANMLLDEVNYLAADVADWLYNRRPT